MKLFVFAQILWNSVDVILNGSFVWYFKVSAQYVDNQEAISGFEDTFEDDNILIRPTVKVIRRELGSRLLWMN